MIEKRTRWSVSTWFYYRWSNQREIQIGLSWLAAKGYSKSSSSFETMSVDRRKIIQAYGAELVLTQVVKEWKISLKQKKRCRTKRLSFPPPTTVPTQKSDGSNNRTRSSFLAKWWLTLTASGVGTGGTISGVSCLGKSQPSRSGLLLKQMNQRFFWRNQDHKSKDFQQVFTCENLG